MIDRHVGKQHGTGKKSLGRNQSPHCATSPWMMSGFVSRSQGSKVVVTAGVGDRLEHDAAHRGVGDAVTNDGAELVEVHLSVDRGHQHHGKPSLGAALQRLGLRVAQVAAPEREVGGFLEAVELQVDLHAQFGESGANFGSWARRMPLVLSTTVRTPLSLAIAQNSRIWGWMDGSPPENMTTSGSPSAATNASSPAST